MLRALGIVTDNIDSGRMIGTAADRYYSRSVRRPGWQCTERQEERDEP